MHRLNVVSSHIVPASWQSSADGNPDTPWRVLGNGGSDKLRPRAGLSQIVAPQDPQRKVAIKQIMTLEGEAEDDAAEDGEITVGTTDPLMPGRVGVAFEYEDKVAASACRRARVRWAGRIQRVLLIKKWRDPRVRRVALDVASWLALQNVRVFVESLELADYRRNMRIAAGTPPVDTLDTSGRSKTSIDLVVSLGGDGTLLHASRLFRFLECACNDLLPPCLVLGLGSLGFLATVEASHWRTVLERILRGHMEPAPCTLRTRLNCIIEGVNAQKIASWNALNECVVLCRGEAIGKLRLSIDGNFVTLVEGDGLIISSATGSTGYSLSCGGPIVCPSVPGTLLTPVAPASLSFRPVLISEMSTIELVLPVGARCGSAAVVIDGRKMGSLERGGRVLIDVAPPVPVLNVAPLDKDWFEAISSKLKWNVRDVEQADVEEPA